METSPVKSLYTPRQAEIISVTALTPEEKLFCLKMVDGVDLCHLPGQFVQLSLPGFGEAPISITSSCSHDGCFELAIRRAGFLTGEMHTKVAGDIVGIRGPFGSFFPVDEFAGMDLILVSGGCGLAPMRSLIKHCEDYRDRFGTVHILYGARSPDHLLFKGDLAAWQGSAGFSCGIIVDSAPSAACYEGATGFVQTLIPPLDIDPTRTAAAIVGPPVMYKGVIDELLAKGIPAERVYISLERNMRCGVGKCGHCAIDHLYCCTDGPVFRLDKVMGLKGAI
ncbi:MAG: FAD/NAD(P)-binding protein [Geobacteraceae bacterium]|nr:FAD/NAD(P)-binding protein [Geobacteraceae bacterium]